MRHGKRRTRFGAQSGRRVATLRNLARSVITHQTIKTTHTKAKEARRVVENLITIAKEDSVAARRRALRVLGDRTLVSKLFKEVAPLFSQRKGGYTRIIPFRIRKGDGANMVFLELTEKKPEEKPKRPRKERAEKPAKKEPAKPLPKTKAAPLIKPALKEEKTVEEAKKEKAKDELRKLGKQKGFLRKVGRFFRRRTNM
jgi:large subunit ribosomal protein L17